MKASPGAAPLRILILRDDRLYASALGRAAQAVFPDAQISFAESVPDAAAILAAGTCDLLITGISTSLGGDVLELLMWWVGHRPNAQRVLVVSADRQHRMLEALRRLEIAGVFDPNHETPDGLAAALTAITKGDRYWSQSVLDFMAECKRTSTPLSHLLTSGEQVLLSVLGDGSDNMTAALLLGLSPATVSTIRRELHRKLGVQHRGELIRVAAQNGFVQFTPSGVVRPGFAFFAADYYARRARSAGCSRSTRFPSEPGRHVDRVAPVFPSSGPWSWIKSGPPCRSAA